MSSEWSWRHPASNELVPSSKRSGKAPRKKCTQHPKPVKRLRLAAREREDLRLYNLTLDINDLRQQIQDLAVRKSLVETRAVYTRFDPNGSIIKTLEEYVRNFTEGFRGTNPVQTAFIDWVCDPCFQIGNNPADDINMLLTQWLRYTELFHVQSFTLTSARIASRDVDQSSVVRCSTRMRGVFTLKALATVFPRSLKEPAIHSRLLGRDWNCDMSFYFHFAPDGKLKRLDPEIDFFTAVNRVLKDTRVTALIMNDAILSQDNHFVGEVVIPEEDDVLMCDDAEPQLESRGPSKVSIFVESRRSHSIDNQVEMRPPSPAVNSPRLSIDYLLS
ncbi:hypothetical protein Poli38472_012523 [Pythium oligandrum]|uniref:Uncharacterized protein n=1 Tax=Pythium oligandrum TaxID=41045 RepID=A0A8K1CFP9_PYTOL|nr:hypothetical protein Poli38472_012523 [Pythium oligandrum]|eukprot:TMW61332.1 hypothetical protein Poli38472_012523 [Pythium oligandrum]